MATLGLHSHGGGAGEGDSGWGLEWVPRTPSPPLNKAIGLWFTTVLLLSLPPRGPTYSCRCLDLQPLSASFEPMQLLAGDVTPERWGLLEDGSFWQPKWERK